MTVSVAEAVPLLPSDEVSSPETLSYVPGRSLVTSTLTVQEASGATAPPESETVVPPSVALVVPPQVLVTPAGEATTRPAGKSSVKARPVASAPEAELSMVNVSVLTPPASMASGVNAFAKLGGTDGVPVLYTSPTLASLASTPGDDEVGASVAGVVPPRHGAIGHVGDEGARVVVALEPARGRRPVHLPDAGAAGVVPGDDEVGASVAGVVPHATEPLSTSATRALASSSRSRPPEAVERYTSPTRASLASYPVTTRSARPSPV